MCVLPGTARKSCLQGRGRRRGRSCLRPGRAVLQEGLTRPIQDGDLFCGEFVFAPHSNEQGAASPAGTRANGVGHSLDTQDGARCPLGTEDRSPHLALSLRQSVLLRSHVMNSLATGRRSQGLGQGPTGWHEHPSSLPWCHPLWSKSLHGAGITEAESLLGPGRNWSLHLPLFPSLMWVGLFHLAQVFSSFGGHLADWPWVCLTLWAI